MKVTKESTDIYTRKVIVEMTEAEWLAIKGFAAARVRAVAGDALRVRAAAARLSQDSDYYWNLSLDWDKLFLNIEEK